MYMAVLHRSVAVWCGCVYCGLGVVSDGIDDSVVDGSW